MKKARTGCTDLFVRMFGLGVYCSVIVVGNVRTISLVIAFAVGIRVAFAVGIVSGVVRTIFLIIVAVEIVFGFCAADILLERAKTD